MSKTTELPIYPDERQQRMQARLSRIEGQVRGVSRMLEEQRPCVEVLQQLASVQAALKGVTKDVLRNYLERCDSFGRLGHLRRIDGRYLQVREVTTCH